MGVVVEVATEVVVEEFDILVEGTGVCWLPLSDGVLLC